MSESLKEKIPESFTPGSVKLDVNSPLEQFFFGLSFIGFFVTLIGFVMLFLNGFTSFAIYFTLTGIVLLFIFGTFCRYSDNFYFLDTDEQKILYHFKFFSLDKVSEYLSFKDVAAVTVNGRRRSNEEGTEWDYQILLLDKTGKITPLSNLLKDKFEKYKAQAKTIAQLTNAEFVEPEPERIAEPGKSKNGLPTFVIRKATAGDAARQSCAVFAVIVGTVVVIAVIYNFFPNLF